MHTVPAIFASITDPFLSLDHQWQFIYLNQAAAQLFEKPAEQLLERCIWSEDIALVNVWEQECRRAKAEQISVSFEINLPAKGWFTMRIYPFAEGTSIYLLPINSPELQRNREAHYYYFLKCILDNIPHRIWCKDRDGKHIAVNESFCQINGKPVEQIIGRSDFEVWPPEIAQVFVTEDQQVMQSGKSLVIEKQIPTAEEQRWFVNIKTPMYGEKGQLIGTTGVSMDITARKRAELALQQVNQELEQRVEERTAALRQSEAQLRQQTQDLQTTLRELQQTQAQLIQSEKMSSLGQLVAGVAHEINNPVNFIYGNLNHANTYTQELLALIQLYQHHYAEPALPIQQQIETIDLDFMIADLPKLMDSMRVGAERIQQIVASLRVFSRMDEADMKSVDLHAGIESTLMILQNRLKTRHFHGAGTNYCRADIEVIRHYDDLQPIECYAGQLNQVFMNIISNAIDAIDEKAGLLHRQPNLAAEFIPTIQIRTALQPNCWIAISIRDNGCGMPEAVQRKLFDPFFTTKPIGKGTGIGLSISYQIITEKHGGRLTCSSTPGAGTEFLIEIPVKQG